MRYFKHILFSYKARQMDKKVLNYWWEAVDLSRFQYSKPYQNPQQYGQYRQCCFSNSAYRGNVY